MIHPFFVISVIAILVYNSNVNFAKANEEIQENTESTSFLLESAKNNDFEGVMKAIESNNEDINAVNINGWTAASFAVSNGNLDILNALVEHSIDLNIASNEGYTPLMVAAAEVRF